MNKRIEWIDTIKGILCIGVFLHHFLLTFYPTIYTGDISTSHSCFDIILSNEPFTILYNGKFFVCCFLVLSGYLLACKLRSKEYDISTIIIKRYIIISFSLFFVSFFSFVMFRLNLYKGSECQEITKSFWLSRGIQKNVSLVSVFTESFLSAPFKGSDEFGSHFWMINYIFLGTLLVCLLHYISKNKNKIIISFLLLIPSYRLLKDGNYLFCYMIGFYISLLISNDRKNDKKSKTLGILMFVFGLLLGSYPCQKDPSSFIYKKISLFMDLIPFNKIATICQIGASMVIFGIVLLANEDFKITIFKKIGKICYSVYLLNEVIIYVISSNVFVFLCKKNINYNLSVLIALIVSLPCLLVLSKLNNKYIMKLCNNISNKLLEKLSNI